MTAIIFNLYYLAIRGAVAGSELAHERSRRSPSSVASRGNLRCPRWSLLGRRRSHDIAFADFCQCHRVPARKHYCRIWIFL